jgi:hypothetical protein
MNCVVRCDSTAVTDGTAFALPGHMSDPRRIDRDEVKDEARIAHENLEQLRDELRVRIRLGGMELRDAFDKIEKEADQLVSRAEPVAARALNEVASRLRRLAHALDGKQ